MGYLDRDGLAYLWQKIKTALASKQDTIIPGDGLSKDGDTLNVENPVRGIYTLNQWNALPEEQKIVGTYIVDDRQYGSGSNWEVYSTEEQVIGTWIDGKPLYRKTVYRIPTPLSSLGGILLADNVDTLVKQFGVIPAIGSTAQYGFPYRNGNERVNAGLSENRELVLEVVGSWSAYSFQGTFEYTKTTDPEVSE